MFLISTSDKLSIIIFVTLLLVMVLIPLIIAAIVLGVASLKRKKLEEFVRTNSETYNDVFNLRLKYSFSDIVPLSIVKSFDNKKYFAEISCEDYLVHILSNDPEKYIKFIKIANENNIFYSDFLWKVSKIKKYKYKTTGRYKLKKLENTEDKLIMRFLKPPCTKYSIKVIILLKNMNGKRIDKKYQVFDEEDIERVAKQLLDNNNGYYANIDIWNALCRVERCKVTNKMRFSIYARDKYRCKMCGKKGNGHNLEIDHIYPISKGGKSTYDNLQTLCHDCNVKKGNKI